MKLLTAWRGLTPAELGAGFVLSHYVGKTALLSLITKVSKMGNPRIEIGTIMPLPKGMPASSVENYKRPDFWASKKLDYAKEYQKYLSGMKSGSEDISGEPVPF